VGDYHVLMQFDIDADPATVHEALTTEEGIRAWWTTHADIEDGRLETSFPDTTQPFEFSVRNGEERVEWVTGGFPPWWAGTTIRWVVEPDPDKPGTRLHFSHRDYDPDNPVIAIITPAWAQIICG
jgi:uncharacterized protein YndB with AHSA1/START domain